MKIVNSILSSLYIITAVAQEQDFKLRETPPFQVVECLCTEGQISMALKKDDAVSNFMPYKVYLSGSWYNLKKKASGNTLRVSSIPRPEKDLEMHADPRKEVGNQPPSISGMPDPGDLSKKPILAYFEGKALYYSELDGCEADKER